ncbi:MAG: DUF975 family protein [Clostridiales bacterium]|jgi:uncharacterized membrane protein|nr:DUF975 family protein [Clostridiales bacterium]
MKSRPEIKAQAKAAYKANTGVSIGAYIVYLLVVGTVSGISFGAGAVILAPVLMVGFSFFTIRLYRGEPLSIGDIFSSAFDNFGRKLGGMLWMGLWTYLWSLLFIIPGIIKALAYSMTPYILANDTNVAATDAIKLSMRMTNGHKGKIFVFMLSFLGWELLSVLTFGILDLVFVGPYRAASMAGLYIELKQNAIDNGIISAAEFAGQRV